MGDAMTVAVVLGDPCDAGVMGHAEEMLGRLGISFERRVIPTPVLGEALRRFVEGTSAAVFIASAGVGGVNLAAAVAALTTRPVLAVPVESASLRGIDLLHASVRQPVGAPAGVLAIGKAGAVNAALAAVAILANSDAALREKLHSFRREQTEKVLADSLPATA
jgi:5-(carboxyamino)imidazole ribonucleotide mutase